MSVLMLHFSTFHSSHSPCTTDIYLTHSMNYSFAPLHHHQDEAGLTTPTEDFEVAHVQTIRAINELKHQVSFTF